MNRIDPPNYTQIPNAVLDNLHKFGEAELRVVIAICRQTFGWHKEEDKISLSQLEKATGLSRQGVINGIEDAIAHGYVARRPDGQSYYYRLLVNEIDQNDCTSQQSRPVVVNEVDQQLVNKVDTQKKGLKKEKEIKDDDDNAREATGEVFNVWQDNIPGTLTPILIDKLNDLTDECGAPSVVYGIVTAVEAGARNFKYVAACARNHAAGNDRPYREERKPRKDRNNGTRWQRSTEVSAEPEPTVSPEDDAFYREHFKRIAAAHAAEAS